MTLIWLCCAFLAGIVAAGQLDNLPAAPCGAAAIAALTLATVWRGSRASFPLLVVAAGLLGVVRYDAARPAPHDPAGVWWYSGSRVQLRGTVEGMPDRRDDVQTVVVAARLLERDGQQPRNVHGLVQIRLGPFPALGNGDQVELAGKLLEPRSSPVFDARAYLARHGIYAVMEHPRIGVLAPGRGFRAVAAGWNDRLRTVMLRLLPEPHAGLLAGMLLGAPGAIPRPVADDFRATGVSHLLVISGWNISVLVGGVAGLLMACGIVRRRAMLLSLPALVGYVLFVGASPSVLRAGIMGALVVWAEVAEREPDGWTALLLACALLAAVDPNIVWDTGFQLSALATGGIFGWYDPLRRGLGRLVRLQASWITGVIASVALTFAALLPTLPVLLYTFGTLSLVAPLANVIVAPAVPFAMLFGGLGATAGLLSEPLGQLIALCAWPFTAWMLQSAHLLARLPAAVLYVPPFSVWWLGPWYAVLGLWLAWWSPVLRERMGGERNVGSSAR